MIELMRKAIIKAAPDARFNIVDGEVVWLDDPVDPALIEQAMQEIRALDQVMEARRAAYPTIEEVTVALAELQEGRSEMWKEVSAKRQAVKLEHPKPGNPDP